MNKKAESALVDIMSVLLFGIIIVILIMLYTRYDDPASHEVMQSFQDVEGDYILLGVLRHEVPYDFETKPFAEVIALTDDKTVIEPVIEAKMEEVMEQISPSLKGQKYYQWNMEIAGDGRDWRFEGKRMDLARITQPTLRILHAETIIPSRDGAPLTIKLMMQVTTT